MRDGVLRVLNGGGETPGLIDGTGLEKLSVSYFFSAPREPYDDLLRRCETVLEIKPALMDWLTYEGRRKVQGSVHPKAHVEGDVTIEAEAVVEANAYIAGPAYICRGAVIRSNACIRDHVLIGPGCKIGHATEVTRSLMMADSRATHMSFIGDSVIGSSVNIGSSFVTTNLRVDRPVREPSTEEILLTVDGHQVSTGQTKFGAIVGDGVQLPAMLSTAPGTLIGPHTVVMPRLQLGGMLPADSRVR